MNDVADVLVIGAGASGGVAALRLVEAGLRVVCLEQGDWPDRATYPGASPAAELVAAKQWSASPAVRRAPADYPIDVGNSELGVVNFNGVGGGTVLYNAQWPRMLPDDFRVRSVDGVADDWPVSYAELQPYYEAADRSFGVSGLGGNPRYPPGADPPFPPLPIGAFGDRASPAPTLSSAGTGGRGPTRSCRSATTDVIPACSAARAARGATKGPRVPAT